MGRHDALCAAVASSVLWLRELSKLFTYAVRRISRPPRPKSARAKLLRWLRFLNRHEKAEKDCVRINSYLQKRALGMKTTRCGSQMRPITGSQTLLIAATWSVACALRKRSRPA